VLDSRLSFLHNDGSTLVTNAALRRPPNVAHRHQFHYTFGCPELTSVTFTDASCHRHKTAAVPGASKKNRFRRSLGYHSPPERTGVKDHRVVKAIGKRINRINSVGVFTSGDSLRDHVGQGLFRRVNYTATGVEFQNLLAHHGDADGDKDVDITDFNVLASNFDPSGANSATNDWTTADFDTDGDVDITDFNGLASNFAPSGYAVSGSAVPEPAGVVLVLLAALVVVASVPRGWVG